MLDTDVITEEIIIDIIIGFGIAVLVLYLDRRRRRNAQNTHKKIIKMDLGKINDIVEYISFNIRDMEKDVDGTLSKLNQHMTRHYRCMESLIQDVQIQHAHCNKLKSDEDEMIKNAIKSVGWILDTYYRQDIPKLQRERVWLEHHDEFYSHAKTIVQAYQEI